MNNRIFVLLAVLLMPLAFLAGVAFVGEDPVLMSISPLSDMDIIPTLGVMLITTFLIERFLEVVINVIRNSPEKDEAYKAETKKIALWVAYVVGVIVSLAGVRMLTPLLDVSSVFGAHAVAFSYIDTLLTAGLLSAGTQGVHDLNKLFTVFVTRPVIQSGSKSQETA